ncbi:30S ribosomal protein S6e [Pyrobaculum aerophilum]|uniref:Small ribosomal subunit protein eS6 n=2 Tax=Pyrobaculum aerophilum TaxID=13773 RepID=RS6E_PYRAE|nr:MULTISPECIES: 30S ribosomal protein S6e [Pyrobaculum]Q8ZX25.1 RecName: Full=Small ribosomal subunit protein eS6; AltName: Full=30S ribosomal protein S6e [Pyrobaculum aerophilum str. IM2]AAL63524.1 ribosomal protein S6 [Pyrobaculum aerophilum str. IM2]MCX8135995.1 30S ribosomal protein S6e [Pyrobaculum aerophilum]RFA94324.1 30S ribosomal protein S6e [Pyrobaculum aerophilum]RFB00263.1 30S ribosomal protein S6e [Pyrobaculum aerophilum]HII46393.1 30S ribosomal protein S6e [Pyrobaculum aerophil
MPTFKLVLSDPMSGKARQFEIKDPLAQRFIGLKIGDELDGVILKDLIELPKGAKIRITGGSGIEGAPMHPGVPGPVKKYILADGPPGYWPPKKGMKKKKLVRGNTISDSIVQINAVIVYPKDYTGPPAIPLGAKELEKEKKAEEAPAQ